MRHIARIAAYAIGRGDVGVEAILERDAFNMACHLIVCRFEGIIMIFGERP